MTDLELEKFMGEVEKTSSCWLWTGVINLAGYGHFYKDRTWKRAHRVSYEHFIGKIPEGMQLDHVVARGCLNRHCVNPAHLEAVTPGENSRRGNGGFNLLVRSELIVNCPKGHPLSGKNLYVDPRGHRGCRECRRESVRRHRRKQRKGT